MNVNTVSKMLARMTNDKQINIWHKVLLKALLHLFVENGMVNPFQVCRRRIMELSLISSTATYHKYIKQLQFMGYIEYEPDYHPALGSKILLKVKGCE